MQRIKSQFVMDVTSLRDVHTPSHCICCCDHFFSFYTFVKLQFLEKTSVFMFIAAKIIRDSIAAHQLYILDHKHALTDFQKKEEKKREDNGNKCIEWCGEV